MTVKEEFAEKIPCKDCIHKNVCNVRSCFEETEIKTTHPFVCVDIKCTEYINDKIPTPREVN